MKRITVRYFAMFREHAGVGEETLELDATTARDVFDATREAMRSPGSDLTLRSRKVVTFKCSGKLRDKVNR